MCYKITATRRLQEAKCEVYGHKALIICVAKFYIAVWLICLIVVRIRSQKSMILVQFLVELSSPKCQTISKFNNIVCGKSSTVTYHV